MSKSILVALSFLMSSSLIAAPKTKSSHLQTNTIYSANVCKTYAQTGHGKDGELFLDPYLLTELKDLSGQVVLDAGCGAGPWTILAAKNGASVYGIDIQTNMIDLAQQAIAKAGVEKQVNLQLGDVAKLPYEENFFDRAISVNVGCNLPATIQIISDKQISTTGVGAHFREISRVLKPAGRAVIAIPASLGVVFSDNQHDEKSVQNHIQLVLAKIGKSDNPNVIVKHLNELEEVYHATFVRHNGKMELVSNEKELQSGEAIWRKIRGTTVPNFYHSEEEYLASLESSGLICEEIKRPCFFGKVKWNMHQSSLKEGEAGLSEAYIDHNPFTIFYVKKA